MDTTEARSHMLELARDAEALLVPERAHEAGREQRSGLRGIAQEARTLLADAGYPGEGVWRVLERADRLFSAGEFDDPDTHAEILDDLRVQIRFLEVLLAPASRDVDMHIIG